MRGGFFTKFSALAHGAPPPDCRQTLGATLSWHLVSVVRPPSSGDLRHRQAYSNCNCVATTTTQLRQIRYNPEKGDDFFDDLLRSSCYTLGYYTTQIDIQIDDRARGEAGKFAYLSVHRVTHQIARRDICLLSEKKTSLSFRRSSNAALVYVQAQEVATGNGYSSPSPNSSFGNDVTSGPNDTHCKRGRSKTTWTRCGQKISIFVFRIKMVHIRGKQVWGQKKDKIMSTQLFDDPIL